jgi:hypothetical protein
MQFTFESRENDSRTGCPGMKTKRSGRPGIVRRQVTKLTPTFL